MKKPAAPHSTVAFDTLLEELGDVWPALRDIWERVDEDGTLTVRYGKKGAYRLTTAQVRNLLRLAGFEPLAPRRVVDGFELQARRQSRKAHPLSCSVIVPCRNEAGNIAALVDRVPDLGTHTELIFVDGASTDGTPERIAEAIRSHPERDIKLLAQENRDGKSGAVFQGFDAAAGDVLIILDADMAVAPEDLPRFYLALAENQADFANGTRFVFPMEPGAMPPLNDVGNRAFAVFLSWLVGTRISDTLCGTKALFKRDWPRIARARPLFGGYDPWGDFDLLLGAAHAGLRLIDVPVRYGARTAGESKMRPLRHGLALARTCLAGVRRLKL